MQKVSLTYSAGYKTVGYKVTMQKSIKLSYTANK